MIAAYLRNSFYYRLSLLRKKAQDISVAQKQCESFLFFMFTKYDWKMTDDCLVLDLNDIFLPPNICDQRIRFSSAKEVIEIEFDFLTITKTKIVCKIQTMSILISLLWWTVELKKDWSITIFSDSSIYR